MGLARSIRSRQGGALVWLALVVTLGGLLSGLAETADGAAVTPEKSSIVVGLPLTTATFLPIYLAEEQGLYAEEGLQVEVVPFHGGTALAQALIGGSVDIGITSLAGVSAGIAAGQPLKVIFGGFNMALFDWYGPAGIESLADTRGLTFGITTYGSSTDFLTRFALLRHGIDPDLDVNIVQAGGSAPRLAAQQAGQLDVNIFTVPEKFMAEDAGFKLLYRQRDLAPDYPFHVVFAHENFIRNNPNTIKAFLRGLIKGMRLAKADPALSQELLVRRVGIDPAYAERTYHDIVVYYDETGVLSSEEGMDFFFEMGIMDGTFDERWPEERYLDRTFLDTLEEWAP